MNTVANICRSTHRHGNALVLLLLLKTWDGDELPTREDLAALIHVSPRQTERDLLRLVKDGEVEKVGRRGQVTRFQLKGLSHLSDETDNALTNTSDLQQSEVTDPGPVLTDVSDESDICDRPLSDSSDTSVRPFDGTPFAPYSDIRTSTDKGAKAPSPRARKEVPPVELPDWLPVESWHEWEEHRREIKKPLTALSVKKQFKLLAKCRARGIPPEQIIEHAIANGWRNLYELKEETHETSNGNGKSQHKRPDARNGAAGKAPPPARQWNVKARAGG